MPEGESVLVSREGDIVECRLNRPPDNYFDVTMIRDLAVAAEEAADAGARVIIVTSNGKNFCAGANFSPAGGGLEGADDGIPALYRQAARFMRTPLPVIAAVNGAAIGGGLGVACAADFRIGCPSSRFSANFARLGFHQGFALSLTLPRIVGQQRSMELLYTGRRIDGTTAHAIGLVDQLVTEDHLLSEARALASEIAAAGPLAVRSIRATQRAAIIDKLDETFEREAAEQARLRATEDWREGVRAMAERRAPEFKGR